MIPSPAAEFRIHSAIPGPVVDWAGIGSPIPELFRRIWYEGLFSGGAIWTVRRRTSKGEGGIRFLYSIVAIHFGKKVQFGLTERPSLKLVWERAMSSRKVTNVEEDLTGALDRWDYTLQRTTPRSSWRWCE